MAQSQVGLTTAKTTYNWADGQLWTEAKIDGILITTIEVWADNVYDNLEQIRKDAWGSSYSLDNDAAVNFSSATLYNKQTAVDTYSSSISLGTSSDADWVDVDATNASLTFTPDTLAGDFKVSFLFTDYVVTTAQQDSLLVCAYRLTDGSTNSNPFEIVVRADRSGDGAGDVVALTTPIHLFHLFTSLSATSKTIKLQKKISTATQIATHSTNGSSTNVMYMLAEKI